MPKADGSHNASRLRQVVEAMPIAAYTTDREGLLTCFNSAAVHFAGRTPQIGRDRWCVSWRLYTADGEPLPHDRCPMAIALKENRAIRGIEAIAERPSGTRVRFKPHPTPLTDGGGELIGGFNMLCELGAAKQSAVLSQEGAHSPQRLLHRNLEMVATILEEARARSSPRETRTTLSVVLERIGALAVAQGVMLGAGIASRIDGWDFLSTASMIARQRLSGPVDLACEATAVDLDMDCAATLALIVHELVAYAARPAPDDCSRVLVVVSLHRDADACVLGVRREGPHGAARPGDGSRLNLAAALARQLNGSLRIEPGAGTHCTVRFPDPRRLH